MSNYPPAPDYGHGYGSQDQTQPPYVPPSYPNQYLQPSTGHPGNYAYPMASHMENNQSAYGYNQNIPSAAIAPAVPPLPLFQGWNQDPMPLPPYTAPQNGMQAPAYNGSYYNNQTYPPAPQQNQAHQSHQPYARYIKPAEEGELSDGEFEYGGAAASVIPNNYDTAQHWNHDGNGYVDTAHRAVYARNQDQSSRAANDYNYGRASPQSRAQESDSYSPYASPRETEYSPVSRDQQYNSNGPAYRPSPPVQKRGNQRSFSNGGQKYPRVKGTPDPYKSSNSHGNGTNGHHALNQTESTSIRELPGAQAPPPQTTTAENTSKEDRQKAEAELLRARRQAQAAVLQLIAKDVYYPIYVAEGFDESIVGRYFDELKLSRAPTKASLQSTADLSATNGTNSVKDSVGLNQISRPDGAQLHQTPSKALGVAAKPAVPTEKELQLKLKMEALRKSREERAQKAAAKNNPISPVATTDKPEQPKDAAVNNASNSPSVTKPSAPSEAQISSYSTSPPNTNTPSQHDTEPIPPPPSSPKQTTTQQTIPIVQAGPVIPGLFLASTATPTSTAMSNPTPYSTGMPNSRKRPVAADFDGPATFTPKRPFGQSRDDRPLVIDVSEDEEEDVAMDLDSQYDQESPVQAVRTLSDNRSTAITNLPPLSDFPARKLFTTPPVTDTTPPAVQQTTKSTLGKPEDLQRKMKEIEEMKKRIADAERRKKARQTSSGANTPRRMEISSNDTNITNKVEASLQIDRLVTIAENKANADQQKLAEAQAAELEKAAELKRNEAEQKRLRREKLSKDLPLVDAEVQQKQTQLEQLQAEMARIQAAIQKDLAEKQRMIEEREKLGQEAEDHLQAQKDKLKDLNSQDTRSSAAPSRPASEPVQDFEHVSKTSPRAASQEQPSQPASFEVKEPITQSESVEVEHQPAAAVSGIVAPETSTHNSDLSESASASQKMEVEPHVVTPDQMLEAALQEAMRAEVESLGVAETVAPDIDMEESYAPKPASGLVGEDVQSPVASPVLQRKIMVAPGGDSDDYEPPEATPPLDTTDDYEPREASPMMVVASPVVNPSPPGSPMHSQPFSPAPPEGFSDLPQSPFLGLLSTGVNEQDDLESTVPSQSSNLQLPVVENHTEENYSKAVQSFVPYESPLKLFRAYRFHPAFKEEIPGGYRSMTYSHKFDPNKELCRYELAGGFCNDPECDLQHFRNVGLSDNDVLTSLTSHNEFSGEQRGKFVSGLKEVFAGLREKNLDKDFDSIASALVAHRAKFLGDDSKVLVLEGTTI